MNIQLSKYFDVGYLGNIQRNTENQEINAIVENDPLYRQSETNLTETQDEAIASALWQLKRKREERPEEPQEDTTGLPAQSIQLLIETLKDHSIDPRLLDLSYATPQQLLWYVYGKWLTGAELETYKRKFIEEVFFKIRNNRESWFYRLRKTSGGCALAYVDKRGELVPLFAGYGNRERYTKEVDANRHPHPKEALNNKDLHSFYTTHFTRCNLNVLSLVEYTLKGNETFKEWLYGAIFRDNSPEAIKEILERVSPEELENAVRELRGITLYLGRNRHQDKELDDFVDAECLPTVYRIASVQHEENVINNEFMLAGALQNSFWSDLIISHKEVVIHPKIAVKLDEAFNLPQGTLAKNSPMTAVEFYQVVTGKRVKTIHKPTTFRVNDQKNTFVVLPEAISYEAYALGATKFIGRSWFELEKGRYLPLALAYCMACVETSVSTLLAVARAMSLDFANVYIPTIQSIRYGETVSETNRIERVASVRPFTYRRDMKIAPQLEAQAIRPRPVGLITWGGHNFSGIAFDVSESVTDFEQSAKGDIQQVRANPDTHQERGLEGLTSYFDLALDVSYDYDRFNAQSVKSGLELPQLTRNQVKRLKGIENSKSYFAHVQEWTRLFADYQLEVDRYLVDEYGLGNLLLELLETRANLDAKPPIDSLSFGVTRQTRIKNIKALMQ